MISSFPELIKAFLACLIIGVAAYRLKVIRGSGFWSGAIVGMGILIFGGWSLFGIILSFFVLAGIATKYKYEKKKAHGVAEREKGARGAGNVFGNGLLALVLAVIEGIFGGGYLLAGYLGAVSAVTSDTAGGEIGRLSKKNPVLITTFNEVPTGTEGAISMLGEIAEFGIAAVIALIALILDIGSGVFAGARMVWITTIAGFFGANVDSLLGATVETNVSWWGNNMTNFASSVAGAACAMVLWAML